MTRARFALRILLAVAFAVAGIAHLLVPEPFLAITPRWVPAPGVVIAWTGIAELAGAAGLLIPRLRRAAAWGLAAYTICVFPANINHAWIDLTGAGDVTDRITLPLAYHLPRLMAQPLIAWSCLFAGAVVDWPFGKYRGGAKRAP